jgi:hypothetical protein
MSFNTPAVLMKESGEIRARLLGIDVDFTSEATNMLQAMGYRVRRKPVAMWLDHEHRQRVFRITHEVYEPPPCSACDPLQQNGPGTIIRTETREIIIDDDLSASSDTITYS